jgi:UDP-N-acetylglucosamine 4,6-dehydratase
MTRFWVTLDQGIRFVIKCIEVMKGGEIFIPKIPSMKIMDLADVITPKAKKKIIGIRPGEKLHEILLTEEEAKHTKEFNEYFIVEPEFPFCEKGNFREGKSLVEGFKYSSDKNKTWFTKEKMRKILKNLDIEK